MTTENLLGLGLMIATLIIIYSAFATAVSISIVLF